MKRGLRSAHFLSTAQHGRTFRCEQFVRVVLEIQPCLSLSDGCRRCILTALAGSERAGAARWQARAVDGMARLAASAGCWIPRMCGTRASVLTSPVLKTMAGAPASPAAQTTWAVVPASAVSKTRANAPASPPSQTRASASASTHSCAERSPCCRTCDAAMGGRRWWVNRSSAAPATLVQSRPWASAAGHAGRVGQWQCPPLRRCPAEMVALLASPWWERRARQDG